MRRKMADKHGDALIISALDEIAWLLNIRGNDVAFNPVVVAYVVLEQDKCTLFVLPEKVDTVARNYLDFNGIDQQPYEAVFDYIHSLSGTVLFDGAKVNQALYEAINQEAKAKANAKANANAVNTKSPILIDKARKNAVEPGGRTHRYAAGLGSPHPLLQVARGTGV